jgi:hypothetical protein
MIKTGPCKDDLLNSLAHSKTVWFRGFADDGTHRPSLFVIRVTKLGLSQNNSVSWTLHGSIITKDGKTPGIYKKCKAYFDDHARRGSFYEEEMYKRNSYEYFKHLDDLTIGTIIRDCKASMPQDMKHLEAYSKTLDPREQLILEAMHVTALSHACVGVEIDHQLSFALHG